MNQFKYASAIRVSLVYFLFSAAWIFLSDYVLLLFFDDLESYRYLSTVKGLFFIVVSALIIYYLVRRELHRLNIVTSSIKRLERFDSLTGLHNRKSYSEELARRANRDMGASVIISDINGLKLLNEVYTSGEGDRLLQRYAKLLQEIMPASAFIARIGGDEFCVLLDHCDVNMVEQLVGELNDRIANDPATSMEYTVTIGSASTCEENVGIYETISVAEDRMYKNKLLITKSASNSLIASLQSTLYERSDETEQHASRIEYICELVGKRLNLSAGDISDLKLFAILHDIGKIGISDAILKKPGKLTPHEYNKMKQHPLIGYKMASSILPLEGIAYYILTHHEHWDGSGYPKGLQGTQIPLASRILAVADAYDAMTNDRVYRNAMSHTEALEELKKYAGKQFDPEVVNTLIEELKNHPFEG